MLYLARSLLYPGSILSLHRKAADALLRSGNGDAALLYLCLLSEKDSRSLGWEALRLDNARQALIEMQLLDPDTPVRTDIPPKLEPDAPPDYTTADISLALQNGGGFASLVPEVERLLGKPLSPADLKTLYLLYDFLALPPEVILTLVGWCVGQTAKKYGAGRKPTLNQIKTEGFRWQKAGVDTLDAAEVHLRRLTEIDERSRQILQIVEITDRKPVGEEKRYLQSWAEMGFADDALRLAYETTVLNTGKRSWSYMHQILRRWKEKGYTTAEQVRQGEGRKRTNSSFRSSGQPSAPAPAPQTDDAAWLLSLTGQKEGT